MDAQTVITQSTENPNLPASPPKLATLSAKRYALSVAYDAAKATKSLAKTKFEAVTAKEQEFDAALSDFGSYVQDQTGGVAEKIVSTGFAVADDNKAPIAMTAPTDFSATPGDVAGEIHTHCKPVKAARGYDNEATTDLTGAGGWGNRTFATKSNCDINGLTSGTMYLVRCRALGAEGPGPWSQAVQCRAA